MRDIDNPVRFRMAISQEALDRAMQEVGLVQCEITRRLVCEHMKRTAYTSVVESARFVADLMAKGN